MPDSDSMQEVQNQPVAAETGGAEERTRRPYVGKKARQSAAAGMVIGRVLGFDDGEKMCLERLGKGAVVRVLFPKMDAAEWLTLQSAFANAGTPWCVIDKSGLLVEMQRKAVQGIPLKRSASKVIECLPRGAELPGGIKWSDFTIPQLTALALMSDLDEDRADSEIALACGGDTDVERLHKWEGNDKFLRVKKFLLLRKQHLLRERALRNLVTGMQSIDTTERVSCTKMSLEVVGLLGKSKAVAAPTSADPKLDADVSAELKDMPAEERASIAKAMLETAALLANVGVAAVGEDGKLSVKSQEEV
jgi:hypothetical protein